MVMSLDSILNSKPLLGCHELYRWVGCPEGTGGWLRENRLNPTAGTQFSPFRAMEPELARYGDVAGFNPDREAIARVPPILGRWV